MFRILRKKNYLRRTVGNKLPWGLVQRTVPEHISQPLETIDWCRIQYRTHVTDSFFGDRQKLKVVNFCQKELCLIIIIAFTKYCCHSIIIAASVAVVIVASNDNIIITSYFNSKVKMMMAMIIMAAEANNDGSNIKWSFEVVPECSCSLVFRYILGDIGMSGLFC